MTDNRNRSRPEEAGQAHFRGLSHAVSFCESSKSYGSCSKNEPVPGRERLPDDRLPISSECIVQIVGPADDWILERLAKKLAAKLPYAEYVPWKPQPTGATRIAYYVNYALYDVPSGLIDVGYFTHLDAENQFLERAREVDFCICMSRLYADWLKSQGIEHVDHIPMGFDFYRYRPRLVLGVVGLLDHPRKGKDLVDHLRQLPFVQILTTEGRVPEPQMRDFYERADYVLIPATVEGGPMSLLEGLGLGKPVIAPEGVGMLQEFPESKYIRRYAKGDAVALEQVVRNCYAEKLECSKLVNGRTWDDWAEGHHHLFMKLLESRRIPTPDPAPGFRFGMMSELDLPWDVDLEPLEAAVDHAAAHLFFGRYGEAAEVLTKASIAFPCLNKMLGSFEEKGTGTYFRRRKMSQSPQEEQIPSPQTPLLAEPGRGDSLAPRVLMIAHVGTLRDRLDKSHYYRYEALCRRPGVKLFGPGLPGYRNGMSLDDAVQMTFGKLRPDLIIHGGDLRDSGVPLVTGLDTTEYLTAIELLDTWANPHLTLDFIRKSRFDIGLIQEAGPHVTFYRQSCPETEFYWTPNGVDTSRFRDYGLPKEYDVILYGVVEPRIYPFRTRLFELLANTPELRVKQIKHPGYYLERQSEAAQVVAGTDLARAINQSWIGIATRSSYNCLLMKYLEIAASGTAVAGNIPDSGRALLEGCMIELDEEMSDEAIVATLRGYLADKDQLKHMIATAAERVARDFSTEAFADRVMEIARSVLRRKNRSSSHANCWLPSAMTSLK